MRKIVCFIVLFIFISGIINAKSQDEVANITPKIGFIPDLSTRAQKDWIDGEKIYLRIAKGEKEENLSTEETRKLKKYDDTKKEIWDIRGEGDDWYNLGGPYKITATSELKDQVGTTYSAINAHDSSFKTVWVEGKPDYGIGEALEYYFKPSSPRINKIIIFNGYLKSNHLWIDNSRVKKLRMYANGKLLSILALKDTTAQQIFEIKPLSSEDKRTVLKLRFEIAEVYPGKKYKDTAITELYFSGLDVL